MPAANAESFILSFMRGQCSILRWRFPSGRPWSAISLRLRI